MEWTKNKSIQLTQVFLLVFALALLGTDIFAFRLIPWYLTVRHLEQFTVPMTVTLYAASVFGWVFLWYMWRLLANLSAGSVFVAENVRALRIVSWCCAGAAAVFFASGFYYFPFFLLAAAGAFMMLIVRIVKNILQKAEEMKSELDLTV